MDKSIYVTIGKRVFRSGAVLGALLACMSVNAEHQNGTAGKDTHFIKEAAQGGLMEVKLGQLGADKAQSQDVKNFGQKLVQDHSKANDELKEIAQKKGVDITSQAEHANRDLNQFSSKSGADFDKAYVRHMIMDHQKDIAKFEKEASQGDDSELKAFAQKQLPVLREHLRMAQDLGRKLGLNVSSINASTDNSGAGAAATVSTDRGTSSYDTHGNRTHESSVHLNSNTDSSNPSVKADLNANGNSDANAQSSVNVHTGEKGDGKVLGVRTEKGDGKTLGLNTDKNDGKFLGIIPDPKKKNSAEVNVNTGNGPSAGASANVDTSNSGKGSSGVYVDTDHNSSKSASISTRSDKDASISASTDRPKTKLFSTDKNDGKLWGIFPAPHKRHSAGVNMDVDKQDKSLDINAHGDTSATGSAPSTSTSSDTSNNRNQ